MMIINNKSSEIAITDINKDKITCEWFNSNGEFLKFEFLLDSYCPELSTKLYELNRQNKLL